MRVDGSVAFRHSSRRYAPSHPLPLRLVRHRLELAAALATTLVLLSEVARAHAPLLSQSEFEWDGPRTVHATLVFAWQDAVYLAKAGRAGDRALGVDAGQDPFVRLVATGIEVRTDGKPCSPRLQEAGPYASDAFLFVVSFDCAGDDRPKKLRVRVPLLRLLGGEHRHLVRLIAGTTIVQATLSASRDEAEIAIPARDGRIDTGGSVPFGRTLRDALGLGVRHILTGWDHVLFLFGIAFGAKRLRSAVLPISAFTLAHSITLAIASLGVFVLSPRLVEPAIAASIAYVSFENVLRPAPAHRSLVTFSFGLLHGFGFAGALTDLALDRDRLIPTLLGFNLGVEVGQLAILAVALPLIPWVESKSGGRVARATCLAIGVVGVGLCAVRLVRPA